MKFSEAKFIRPCDLGKPRQNLGFLKKELALYQVPFFVGMTGIAVIHKGCLVQRTCRRAVDEIHNAHCIDFAECKFKSFLIALKFAVPNG